MIKRWTPGSIQSSCHITQEEVIEEKMFRSPCPFLFKHDASTGSPDFPWLPDVLSFKQ